MNTSQVLRRIVLGCRTTVLVVGSLAVTAGADESESTTPTLVDLSESFQDLADRVLPAVVQIHTYGDVPATGPGASVLNPFTSTGSGVIVSADGLILTNAHVVAGARRIQVIFSTRLTDAPDRRSILPAAGQRVGARVVGTDAETDLAVLRVDRQDLPALDFGDSDSVRPGQLVFAFGSPAGLTNSVSMGVVSAIARQPAPDHAMVYIQTDAAISPGSSGGPLVNADGQVIGISTWILSRSGGSEGLGFAVPSNIARVVFEQIRNTGHVTRGEIGVNAQTITPSIAEAFSLPRSQGVILGDVDPDGPADRAGLRAGDIVLALNGKPMENGRQLDVNVYGKPIGGRITLEILRGNDRRMYDVEVSRRPDAPNSFTDLITGDRNHIEELGVLALELDARIRDRLPPLRRRTGLIVVALSGPASAEGLHVGDVVHRIGDVEITSLATAREALSGVRVGDLIGLQIERAGQLSLIAVYRR